MLTKYTYKSFHRKGDAPLYYLYSHTSFNISLQRIHIKLPKAMENDDFYGRLNTTVYV